MKTLKIIRDIAAILAMLSAVVLVVYFVMQGNKDATITAVIFGLFFGASIPFNWKDYRKQETRSELTIPVSPQTFYGKSLLWGFFTITSLILMPLDKVTWPFFLLFGFMGLFICLSNIILYKFRKQIED